MSTKGISLRTKRKNKPPTISNPKISQPLQQTGDTPNFGSFAPNLPVENVRQRPPQAGGQTSDLVKRRYSTRFNNLPSDFDVTAPPVPGISSQYAPQAARIPQNSAPTRSTGLTIDEKVFGDPRLQPEQYVSQLLSDATETDIDDYKRSLVKIRNRTNTDLQQNVYQNRVQFIQISKQAEKLKGEMRALRNLMSELKLSTVAERQTPTTPEENYPSTLTKRDRRTSVADRSALWNSQLQALWKNVEGSQKFLPATPGRHVVQDAGIWIELDNATWKTRRVMQIVLLNDHLLVGQRKKKKVENASDSRATLSKIVADRCWPLLDIELVDLSANDVGSSKSRLSDAIMIRGAGQESFTYRKDKADGIGKASLLSNFRKAGEELRKSLRTEGGNNNQNKQAINYFASRDPSVLQQTELLETLSDMKDRSSMEIEVDGKQQNLRWIDAQVDELDIDIALQRFEKAVTKVEELRQLANTTRGNVMAKEIISFRANERASKLADLLGRELVDTHNELKKTKSNIVWLTRLGYEDRAREVYLQARTQIIVHRTRQCIFEGNLHQYIWEISFVYFTIIRNTVTNFSNCFPTMTMSACVKWAKEQVDAFNLILTRQLSSVDKTSPVWTECMDQAKEHAKMLAEVGLDFKEYIGRDARRDSGGASGTNVGLGLA